MKKGQKTLRQGHSAELSRSPQGGERSRTITKEMTIGEVIKKYPKATFVFMDYGLHCVGCPMAQNETIEEAAKLHQMDLDKLLKDLNKAAEK